MLRIIQIMISVISLSAASNSLIGFRPSAVARCSNIVATIGITVPFAINGIIGFSCFLFAG